MSMPFHCSSRFGSFCGRLAFIAKDVCGRLSVFLKSAAMLGRETNSGGATFQLQLRDLPFDVRQRGFELRAAILVRGRLELVADVRARQLELFAFLAQRHLVSIEPRCFAPFLA